MKLQKKTTATWNLNPEAKRYKNTEDCQQENVNLEIHFIFQTLLVETFLGGMNLFSRHVQVQIIFGIIMSEANLSDVQKGLRYIRSVFSFKVLHVQGISARLRARANSRSCCSCRRSLRIRSASSLWLSRLAHSSCCDSLPTWTANKHRKTLHIHIHSKRFQAELGDRAKTIKGHFYPLKMSIHYYYFFINNYFNYLNM